MPHRRVESVYLLQRMDSFDGLAVLATTSAPTSTTPSPAAYLTAEAGSPLTMRQLIHAIQREHQKLGRSAPASEFGAHADLLIL